MENKEEIINDTEKKMEEIIEVHQKEVVQSEDSDEGANLISFKDDEKKTDDSDCQNEKMDDVEPKQSVESRFQYTKEELIAISKLSCARMRPKCLDPAFDSNGLWDPDKWRNSKALETPSNPGTRSSDSHQKYSLNKADRDLPVKKGNFDQRERVLEESQEEIVLSPQRPRFGAGCHVAPRNDGRNREVSEEKSDNYTRSSTDERNDAHYHRFKRVGTGRISNSNGNSREWPSDRNYDKARDGQYDKVREREGQYDRDESQRRGRYNKFHDFEGRGYRNRYHSRRDDRYNREDDNEPEWFTGGPTSQHDTIELKGFEENDDAEDRKHKEVGNVNNLPHTDESTTKRDENRGLLRHHISPTTLDSSSELLVNSVTNDSKDDFDINEMFKSLEGWKNMPSDNEIIDATSEGTDGGTSKFAQWFGSQPTSTCRSSANNTIPSFTPTSVIRKILSDKDKESANRMVAGDQLDVSRFSMSSQSKETNGVMSHQQNLSPIPRAIVKGHTVQNLSPITQRQQIIKHLNSGKVSPHSSPSFQTVNDMDQINKMMEQQRLQHNVAAAAAALAAQRQYNISPMPVYPVTASTAMRMGVTRQALAPSLVHQSIQQPAPGNVGLQMIRSQMVHPQNAAMRHPSLQQMQQLNQITSINQRGRLDPRQIQSIAQARGLHPLAIQQLLVNAAAANIQTQAAAAAAAAAAVSAAQAAALGHGVPACQPGQRLGQMDILHHFSQNQQANFQNQQMMRPQNPQFRQGSPGNVKQSSDLMKWFGNDVLSQNLPDMPAVQRKVLHLEDIEN